ncbi:hypothetical protein D7V97_21385 [Corallococcus sp. CA053C]|uniref:hypothetical protein n=1 Tax=Corallococcus sp. CA053C TaxID=2316732 RepID=UPI000EA29A95|nr:hypothetical protein [Corallococcus sp. CA053C]RKH07419.1 hypothetical protein D7V97_21385 [Corallococcus sp. CA053C]
MRRTCQRGVQRWALFRSGEVSTQGFHAPDNLTQELSVDLPAPKLGMATPQAGPASPGFA